MPAFAPANEKYAIEGTVGGGGMGEVFLVTDRDLRRQVAMKVLRAESASDAEARVQFVAEAQATSQLEHPGIPPVHDIGVASDGRVWFTMKLVRGRTLSEVLHDLFVKRAEVHREWTLHRLVGVVERLCETLHFAHERGVVHRDVKPDNVMLGDYGEVHLMDWGLARVEDAPEETGGAIDLAEVERIATARTDSGTKTDHGTIKGTLAYMAPEQVRGHVDKRTDVYAMGLLLYEVLTLQPAFDVKGSDLLRRVMEVAIPPIETRNPRRSVPEALADICRRATANVPEARYPTATAMGAALRSWLDGTSERERRHKEAEAFAAKGIEAVAAYERAKHSVVEAEAEVERQSGAFKSWQALVEKRPLLEARKGHEAAVEEVALTFAEALKWFEAALAQEEGNRSARAAMANLWKGRLDDAERRGDRADTRYALKMVERFDDGALRAYVAGDGVLALASNPSGADVTLYRYVERDGVLVASEERPLGRTPIARVSLPTGSYLCILKTPGYRDVRYPVHITRNRRWEGTVRMRTEQEIGEGFVYVPGGPFVYGEGKMTQTLDLRDFAIAEYPVTFGEYSEFLAALERDGGADAVKERLPREIEQGPLVIRQDDGTYRVKRDMIGGPPADRCLREYGPGWMERLPVVCVSFDDAVAYCRWKSTTTSRVWRLPTEEEREKGARGVDGRRFPWGDVEDASLLKGSESRPEQNQPEPVGAFPTARSVYGMGDAAGGVWDWTDSEPDPRRPFSRVLRGGSWCCGNLAYCRTSFRMALTPANRRTDYGFRCARSL